VEIKLRIFFPEQRSSFKSTGRVVLAEHQQQREGNSTNLCHIGFEIFSPTALTRLTALQKRLKIFPYVMRWRCSSTAELLGYD